MNIYQPQYKKHAFVLNECVSI